jgi:formate dehydrogenase
MNARTIPIVAVSDTRQRKRSAPKGRVVDPAALADVQRLLGSESRARDLLIEHLHRLQDHFGHLSATAPGGAGAGGLQGGRAATRCSRLHRWRAQVEDVIKALEDTSGLRGLGGAGFPAGRKWRIVRRAARPAPDGGQHRRRRARHLQGPHYLERDPHRFLEGMLIAAWAVGIDASTSTCATSTRRARHARSRARSRCCAEAAVPDAGHPRAARRGAGAYICGEESR